MKNKGISLITLVITIIIMIILAGAIILSLTQSGIFDKANEATDKYNSKQQQILDDLIWAENYPNGGNTSNWVSGYVDEVPIPKGFVASPYDGTDGMPAENTKAGGLVIYALNEGETSIPTTEAHQTSLENRNQFVWVPVDKENFATKFVRDGFGQKTLSSTVGSGYWELALKDDNTPSETQGSYVSPTTLVEAKAMYESVQKYGGFYIARYEVGKDASGNVSITMGKYPYNYVKWSDTMNETANDGGAVALSRAFYPNNSDNTTGVVSTLTYGVQWDTTLNWWTGKDLTDSTEYGNYYNTTIVKNDEKNEYNENAQYSDDKGKSWNDAVEKTFDEENDEGNSWLLTTGAFKNANVNNIYDMAGNLYEWTMEGDSDSTRVSRGGYFMSNGHNSPVIYRFSSSYHNGYDSVGFRPSLYIK